MRTVWFVVVVSFGFHEAVLDEFTGSAYMRMYSILDLLCVAGFERLDQRLVFVEDLVPAFALQDLARLAFPSRMNVAMHPLTRVLYHGCARRVSIQYTMKFAVRLEERRGRRLSCYSLSSALRVLDPLRQLRGFKRIRENEHLQ